jgi:pimeloyl-ACP methyl ester carboxylesterase
MLAISIPGIDGKCGVLRTNTSGMDVAYDMRGNGPPIVLLHGFLSDHRDWAPQLGGLSGDFQLVAWDAPGCGESPDPPESWRMGDYAELLAGLLDEAELETVHLAGLSWGGTLAQEFYRRYPERVRSLILADTYAGWGPSLGEQACGERLELCLRLSEAAPAELVSTLMGGMVTSEASADVKKELSAILSDFHPSGFRIMSCAVAEADTTDVWASIRVPTLLIWGEADARSPLSVAEAFRAGIANARLAVIPGGHVSNMESPDEFNAAVRAFVGEVEAAARRVS